MGQIVRPTLGHQNQTHRIVDEQGCYRERSFSPRHVAAALSTHRQPPLITPTPHQLHLEWMNTKRIGVVVIPIHQEEGSKSPSGAEKRLRF